MLKDFGRDLITYNRPDNRGILIGEVIKIDRKKHIYKIRRRSRKRRWNRT